MAVILNDFIFMWAQVISEKLMEGKTNSSMIWYRWDIILSSNEELQDTRELQHLQSLSFGETINFASWVTRSVAESGYDMSTFKAIYFAFKMQVYPSLSSWFTESQNHRIVGVGRDLCGSSSQWKCSHRFQRIVVQLQQSQINEQTVNELEWNHDLVWPTCAIANWS